MLYIFIFEFQKIKICKTVLNIHMTEFCWGEGKGKQIAEYSIPVFTAKHVWSYHRNLGVYIAVVPVNSLFNFSFYL